MPADPELVEKLEQYAQLVWRGKQHGMSRRAFLIQGLRLGLSLPAIGAVLAGCGVDPAIQRAFEPTASLAPARLFPTTTVAPPATAIARATIEPSATATSPPAPTPVPSTARFAVIGDFGEAGPPAAQVAALVAGWQPDFVVTTGDNNYPTGSAETIDANIGQYYSAFMAGANTAHGPAAQVNRFFPVLGNHDADTDAARPYIDYFTLPGNERYYSVDWPPVRIYALNSVPWVEPDGSHPESAQAAWLQQELANTSDRWKIVVFHHPPYSSDHRGSVEWMRWPFREWGADIALCGHNHVYERVEVDGFPYLVNGLGGGARYAWGPVVEGSQVRYNEGHGAILATATPEQLTFEFITATNGTVIDTYTLRR